MCTGLGPPDRDHRGNVFEDFALKAHRIVHQTCVLVGPFALLSAYVVVGPARHAIGPPGTVIDQ